MAAPLRLQYRIAIPFALVAVVTTSAAAWVAIAAVSRTLEGRAIAQARNAAELLGQSDLVLNAAPLRSAKQISGVDVVTYASSGQVLATTIEGARAATVLPLVATPEAARAALASPDGVPIVRRMSCDTPCLVAYTKVATLPDTVVAAVLETAEVEAATSAITRTLVTATAVALVLMILVSQAVARRVAAPIHTLVAFAHTASPSSGAERAPVGADEVGRLGAAFNAMLDRLQRSQDALVRSEKMGLAGLMAARVAHDVRNPLFSMKLQTQLLGARLDADEQSQTAVQAILRDIQQVEGVVRDLIELARPGELAPQPAALNDVVQEVLQQLGPQLTYRRIAVETSLAGDLRPLPLDVGRFKQVLLNILGNAADAMPTGGTLAVCSAVSPDGRSVLLDVVDTGVGIDPAIRDHIFDPFVSTKRDGVGLGLVNARAVVESHGGTIALTPAAPTGTRARITLPLA